MALYSFKAKDQKGKVIEDVIQASNKDEAVSSLKTEGLQILTMRPIDKGLSRINFGKISVAEKAAFCRFLATILRSGLPLSEAVEIIREETKNKRLQKVLLDISFGVRKGTSLSAVISKHKADFDSVFLTMIKAGEESGTLDKSFDYLAKQLLATHELMQKVKGALMYPAVIVAAMTANAIIMIAFVLPKISDVFIRLNVELPWYTEIVLKLGLFVGDNIALIIGFIVFIGFIIVMIFLIHSTREFMINIFMRMPLIKSVARDLDIARFSRTLSTLLKSGVPILIALEVSSDVLKQPKLKKQSEAFKGGVEKGRSLSEILSEGEKDVFPSTMVQTIKAGEKTGSLDAVLEEMADFYEKEVDFGLKRLTSLLEPLLMLVIGLAVGVMVVMMIVPIYNIVGGLEGQL